IPFPGSPSVTSETRLSVFDPDDRLIASDYNNDNPVKQGTATFEGHDLSAFGSGVTVTPEQPFTFTADRPGVYRFVISKEAPLFDGSTLKDQDQPYQLQVKGLGN